MSQVHYAVEADINFSTGDLRERNSQPMASHSHGDSGQGIFAFAGVHSEGAAGQLLPHSDQATLVPSSNNFICRLPSLIPGPRCYSDASLAPDSRSNAVRSVGLGIFSLNPGQHMKCFIRARVHQVSSVLMAESAGLALCNDKCIAQNQ